MLSCVSLSWGPHYYYYHYYLNFWRHQEWQREKHQRHPRFSQQTPRQAGPGWHAGGWILHRETDALLFCPARLMLPCLQFRYAVLSPFILFYFIFWFGWLGALLGSQLSVREISGCLGLCFLSTYLSFGFHLTVLSLAQTPLPTDGAGAPRRTSTRQTTGALSGPGLPVPWSRPGVPSAELWGETSRLSRAWTCPQGWESFEDLYVPTALPPPSRSWVLWLPEFLCSSLTLQNCWTFLFKRWALQSWARSLPLTKASTEVACVPHVSG